MSTHEELVAKGSSTARNGFRNEDDIVEKFNSWQDDEEAKRWLETMGYKLKEIEKVEAVKVTGNYKPDIQVKIKIYLKDVISPENISIKLVSNPQGFNQIDKRWVDKYVELWNIPEELAIILKKYTGEIAPSRSDLKDSRRMFFDEMDSDAQNKIIQFFNQNKILVISDIVKGRGIMTADWMLVVLKTNEEVKWILRNINEVMNIFGAGNVQITEKGNLKIGKVSMQRKGGDGGRETAQMLQFKVNPVILFE